MKAMLVAVSVFSTVAGGWLAVMELILRHPGFPQRIVIAALIVAQSVLTLLVISDALGRIARIVCTAGAFGILAIGSLALLRNLTGPHFEGFAIIIGAALVVQSALTLWTTLHGHLIGGLATT